MPKFLLSTGASCRVHLSATLDCLFANGRDLFPLLSLLVPARPLPSPHLCLMRDSVAFPAALTTLINRAACIRRQGSIQSNSPHLHDRNSDGDGRTAAVPCPDPLPLRARLPEGCPPFKTSRTDSASPPRPHRGKLLGLEALAAWRSIARTAQSRCSAALEPNEQATQSNVRLGGSHLPRMATSWIMPISWDE